MGFTFRTGTNGLVHVIVTGDHDTLNDALNDIFSSRPPLGWVGDGPSTYWIDRARRQFEEARANGSVECFVGGNDAQLRLIDGTVEARYEYSYPDEPGDRMPVDEFVALLDEWRTRIKASAAKATSPLPETYRRNPGIPTGPVQLGFDVRKDDDGPVVVIPLINRFSLVSLVTVFEAWQRFDVFGGYGGLVPSAYRFGDLRRHFLGTGDRQSPTAGHAWLLGCDCGEVGCWPLTAKIVLTDSSVTWTDFAQEHRKSRDYSGFGPFVFVRDSYEREVAAMVDALISL